MTLPQVTTASTGHVAHHEEMDSYLHGGDTNLPLDITAGVTTGHVSHHAAIDALLGLATQDVSTPQAHVDAHNIIHVEATPGPRGAYGQQAATGDVPGWPVSFTSSHSTFASLQTAVNTAGTGRKFRITASFAFTATIAPHASDEFWFNPGVTITRSGAIASALAANVNNVKVMNGKFSGFNSGGGAVGNFNDKTISSNAGAGWEIAYCEISGTYYPWAVDGPAGGGAANWHVHHNYFHDCAEPGAAYSTNDCVVEDNELADNGIINTIGGEHKWTGTLRFRFRHNWVHGGSRCGCWYDTGNSESITEWNLFEGNGGDTNTSGAIMVEQNRYTNASQSNNDDGDLFVSADRNIIRYNLIRDELGAAITIRNSIWTEIYGNFMSNCCITSGNKVYFQSSADGNDADLQGNHYDLAEVNFHHNSITLGGSTHVLILFDVQNFGDESAWWTTQTKNLDCDYNTYEPLSQSTPFYWNNAYRTWSYWQSIPQDVHGSVV